MKKSTNNSITRGKTREQASKAVFSQKKPQVQKVAPIKQQTIVLQQTLNQSTLNDTLDQFVNTTDMNLETIVEKNQTPYSPMARDIKNRQLDMISDFNLTANDQLNSLTPHLLNEGTDKLNPKLSRLDDTDLAQSSRDYRNILTTSTPSIIDQKLLQQNRSDSTLSNLTLGQNKQSNIAKAGQDDFDQTSQILPSESSIEIKPIIFKKKSPSKKNSALPSKKNSVNPSKKNSVNPSKKNSVAPSKKNSVGKVQQFTMNEEDEYEYEDEDEEEEEYEYEEEEDEDDEYEYEDQEEEEKDQKEKKLGTIEEQITLDPYKNMISAAKSSIEANDGQNRRSLQHPMSQQSRQPLPHTNVVSQSLQFHLNQADSAKTNTISPTFGNRYQPKQPPIQFNEMYGNNQLIVSDFENCNPQSSIDANPQFIKAGQIGRISQNTNLSQQVDVTASQNSQQKNKMQFSRQVHPVQISVNTSQNNNFIPQYTTSPNNIRVPQEMQMVNQSQFGRNQSIPFNSRTNSVQRGPTPARLQFSVRESKDIFTHKINNNAQQLSQNKRPVQNVQNEESQEPTHCKICLEADCTKETGKMITPCKCSGTLRNVHEECLKTWIITQQKEIMEAQCEVCMKTYDQNITFGLKMNARNALNDGKMNCLTSSVIFLFITAIAIIIGLLFQRNNDINNSPGPQSDAFLENSTHVISLITICFVIMLILFIIVYYTLKEACCILVVKDWIISQYVASPPPEESHIIEGTYVNPHTEYNHYVYQSMQNRSIIPYEQFLKERRSMPAVVGYYQQQEEINYQNQDNIQAINQSRNSPKSRVSQAHSCVTQMQKQQQKNLTKQEQEQRIKQLLSMKKKLNKPIIFNSKIYTSSRRQSVNEPVRQTEQIQS